MKADLYIRVSTDEQAEKGYSQRDQEERLRKHCALRNITVRRIMYEDYSAKTFKRPMWKEYLAELKSKKNLVDMVLFTKWDRFSRNAADAFQMINTLRRFGVEPCAIEQALDLDIPENKIMLGIYLTAPEVENDRRSLNVRYGLRRAVKEGRWMNGAPLGYINRNVDGRKFIEPEQPFADILKWSFETLAERKLYVEDVYKMAKAKGLTCGRSNFWLLIRNPVYCGKIFLRGYKDEPDMLIRGNHQPIISESLFLEVQEFLDGRKKTYRTTVNSHPELVLRGYLLCPECGRKLTGSASKGRRMRYYYYHCVHPCRTRFKAEDTNKLFVKELWRFVPKPGMVSVYTELITSAYRKQHANSDAATRQLNTSLAEYQGMINRAREKFVRDEMTRLDYDLVKKQYEAEIDKIEIELVELSKDKVDIKDMVKKAINNLSMIGDCFRDLDTRGKRRIVGSIFPEKVVFDGEAFRTAKLNEAVELIFNVGKGLRGKKNGQTDEKIDLSTSVA